MTLSQVDEIFKRVVPGDAYYLAHKST